MEKALSPALVFAFYFISGICLVSLGFNAFLLIDRNNPNFWSDIKLSIKKPPPVTTADHIKGPFPSATTIIEYSDFQCPYCKQMHQELEQLSAKTSMTWVFRHHPLEAIHPLALKAAIASECAAKQNKFWEYSDALFNNQANLHSDSDFAPLALRVGLDLSEFESCWNSVPIDFIRHQMAESADAEIKLTPTIFINGHRINGVIPYEDLEQLLKKK